MKIMTPASLHVTHNVSLQRFEVQAGDEQIALLSYVHEGDRVIFDHTFVPDGLRGRGLPSELSSTCQLQSSDP